MEKMVALTYTELLAVATAAKASSTRDWCMIVMAYSQGLRASEVCELKTTSVVDGFVKVFRKKHSHPTLNPLVRNPYQPMLDEVKAVATWLTVRDSKTDALFTSRKHSRDGHISPNQFYRIFKAYAKASGLPSHKQHPHCLRHTTCTELVRHDMSIAKVQKYIGHADIRTTQRYVAVSSEEAAAAASKAFSRAARRAI